ncbi:MAG TPA: cation diffusion facilitator family transporter [Candidatus Paceibacterota bacterium]|nr:cation diffusion facilitator family transporter [Candidatus Paceibacterota bacterium]
MDNRNARFKEIEKVLVITLCLNLLASVAKITLGLTTGVMAIAADGFHSLGDTFSNVVGIVGIRLAKRPPDQEHSYGYDRFEDVATLLVVSLISITCYKVFETGISHLLSPVIIKMDSLMIAIIVGSMAINAITVIYEGGAGKRLKSQLLIADALETKSDLWVSGVVILSTGISSFTGWYWLDGVSTILIGLMIVKIILEIVVPTAKQLADAQAVNPELILQVIMTVSEVKWCHGICSRGRPNFFFLDCHIGIAPDISIEKAHDDICHKVKLALRDSFPGLKRVSIHIEPDNEEAKSRKKRVFSH